MHDPINEEMATSLFQEECKIVAEDLEKHAKCVGSTLTPIYAATMIKAAMLLREVSGGI